MTSRKCHLLANALFATAVLVVALAVAASAASPLKITNCNRAASSPKLLTLTCGDANMALNGMSWSSFGGAVAQGRGTFVANTCEPNCAAGKDVSYPVKVKATGVLRCKHGLRVYGRLALQFTGRAPGPGVPRNWKLACPY
ncbi:MAG TPA: hypothetical protein VIH92_14780 [Solirubrobacteraceae bacterium]